MIESPCNAVCTLDVDDVCLGCFRTGAEIFSWSEMSDDERREVMERVKERSDD